MEYLELFDAALESGDAKRFSFGEICGRIGVSPRKMNRILRDSTGLCGDDIVKCYEFNLPYLFL